MLNIIHKTNADGTKTYANIATVSPLPKGFECPAQVNKTILLDYDNFDGAVFDSMPDFIKDKIKTSLEYAAMMDRPVVSMPIVDEPSDLTSDIPF